MVYIFKIYRSDYYVIFRKVSRVVWRKFLAGEIHPSIEYYSLEFGFRYVSLRISIIVVDRWVTLESPSKK